MLKQKAAEQRPKHESALFTLTGPLTQRKQPAVQTLRHVGKKATLLPCAGEPVIGSLQAFDQFTLEIDAADGGTALVYKHTVTAILAKGGEGADRGRR